MKIRSILIVIALAVMIGSVGGVESGSLSLAQCCINCGISGIVAMILTAINNKKGY